MSSDLDGAFAALKRVLVKLAAGRHVIQDDTTHYDLHSARFDAKGKPVFLAAVKIGAKKVAFYLMPVYENPTLFEAYRMHSNGVCRAGRVLTLTPQTRR